MTRILFTKAHPAITPEPTKAQAESGNYKKASLKWNGLTIKIENPAGSVRRGDTWETRMLYDYGYIARSEAVDGDEVDVYLGPDLDAAPMVYVVHQRKWSDWNAYDEDKCMLGFLSEESAREAYLKHYDDPRFLGPITAMPVAEFVEKVKATREKPAMIKSILFLKARTKGDNRTVDLFGDTHIETKTRKDGVVQGYRVANSKPSPKMDHAAIAKQVLEWKKKRKGSLSSRAGWIGGWAHENGKKISDHDEGLILAEIAKLIEAEKPVVRTGDALADYWANSAGASIERDVKAGKAKVVKVVENVKPPKLDLPTVDHDGDTWHVLNTGASRDDGKVFAHLSSTTRGRGAKNGVQPVQINDWIDPPADTVTEPRDELIKEHERLVDVLESPSHEDDKAEAKKQAKELEEYKAGDVDHPAPVNKRTLSSLGLDDDARSKWIDYHRQQHEARYSDLEKVKKDLQAAQSKLDKAETAYNEAKAAYDGFSTSSLPGSKERAEQAAAYANKMNDEYRKQLRNVERLSNAHTGLVDKIAKLAREKNELLPGSGDVRFNLMAWRNRTDEEDAEHAKMFSRVYKDWKKGSKPILLTKPKNKLTINGEDGNIASDNNNNGSIQMKGTIERDRSGRFLALEEGTKKPVNADGSLGSSYSPPTYDTEEAARDALVAREERNAKYAAANTPEKQAENKAARESEKAAKQAQRSEAEAALNDAIENIKVPSGYSLSRGKFANKNDIFVSGPFDQALHERIKRAGGSWDSVDKGWNISVENANKSLVNAFNNAAKANEKAANDDRARKLKDEEERERKYIEKQNQFAEEEKRKQKAVASRVKVPHGKYKVGDIVNGKKVTSLGQSWDEAQRMIQVTDDNSSAYGMQPGLDSYPRIADPNHKAGKYQYAYFE